DHWIDRGKTPCQGGWPTIPINTRQSGPVNKVTGRGGTFVSWLGYLGDPGCWVWMPAWWRQKASTGVKKYGQAFKDIGSADERFTLSVRQACC
ncbi:hypothetical protein, partial [Arcanobacterium haemolyticum]